MDILRRNLSDEVNVVQRLQGMRTLQNGLERTYKTAGKEDRVIIKNMVSELKRDTGFLKDEVKRIEPRELARSATHIGRMIVKGSAPKLARTWLKWSAIGYAFNKTFTPENKARDVKFAVAGQVPGLEYLRAVDLSPRYYDPKYGVVAAASSYTPFLGLIDSSLPGRPITRLVHQTLFGKSESGKKGKRNTNVARMR
jgi:hypothetical protein